jgi:hypothetical protein
VGAVVEEAVGLEGAVAARLDGELAPDPFGVELDALVDDVLVPGRGGGG